MCLVEGWGEFDAGPSCTCGADVGDGDGLVACRHTDTDLVTDGKTVRVADLDIRRAGARICRKIGTSRLRADLCDGNSFDPMADARDIQPDLVTDRNIGD